MDRSHLSVWPYQYISPVHFTSGVTVVTQSPLTSEVGGSNPGPYVGTLVVAYQWSVVYSTEPLANCMYWFPLPTKTTCHDMTCTVLKVI